MISAIIRILQCLAGRPIKGYLPIRAHNIIAGEKAVCPAWRFLSD
jgi:hypothetical protein